MAAAEAGSSRLLPKYGSSSAAVLATQQQNRNRVQATHWHSETSCSAVLKVSTHSSPDGDTMAQRCR